MRLLVSAWVLLLVSPVLVWAHGIGAEWKIRHGVIQVSAFYDDDTPAVLAKVDLVDGTGKVLVTAKTDAQGACTLSSPLAAGDYVLIVDGGMGHQTRVSIAVPLSIPVLGTTIAGLGASPCGHLVAFGLTNGAAPRQAVPIGADHVIENYKTGFSRESFTRFPFLKVGLGLAAIVLFSVAFLAARSRPRKRNTPPE